MKYIIPLALLCCSCSASLYSYVTKQGHWVYDRTTEGVAKANLEVLIDRAQHLLEGGEDITDYDFFFHSHLMSVPHKGKTVRAGTVTMLDKKQVHIAVFTDCLVMSNIIREFVYLAHDPTRKQENKELWRKTKALEDELVKECRKEDIMREIQIRGPSFREIRVE